MFLVRVESVSQLVHSRAHCSCFKSQDPITNLHVISRLLQVDEASTSSAKHQEHRNKLLPLLPRGTDIGGKTAEVCLICSEEIPFDVRAEQVLPAECRRKHTWGKSNVLQSALREADCRNDRAMLGHLSPHYDAIRPHVSDVPLQVATAESADSRESLVHRARHAKCCDFMSQVRRALEECSVGHCCPYWSIQTAIRLAASRY